MWKMVETTEHGPAREFWLLHCLYIHLLLSWHLFSHCSIILTKKKQISN